MTSAQILQCLFLCLREPLCFRLQSIPCRLGGRTYALPRHLDEANFSSDVKHRDGVRVDDEEGDEVDDLEQPRAAFTPLQDQQADHGAERDDGVKDSQ